MRFILDVKKLPELAGLSPEQKQQVEGISSFVGCWDWRTMTPVMIGATCFYYSFDGNGYLVAIGGLFMMAFFPMLVIRSHHHAKRIAKAYLVSETPPSENAEPNEPAAASISTMQFLLSRGGILFGLLMAGASIYFRCWELVGLGAALLYFGLMVIASYSVCGHCQQVMYGFGIKPAHCSKCGRAYKKIDG